MVSAAGTTKDVDRDVIKRPRQDLNLQPLGSTPVLYHLELRGLPALTSADSARPSVARVTPLYFRARGVGSEIPSDLRRQGVSQRFTALGLDGEGRGVGEGGGHLVGHVDHGPTTRRPRLFGEFEKVAGRAGGVDGRGAVDEDRLHQGLFRGGGRNDGDGDRGRPGVP